MGASANSWALLVGLTAFAGWTFSQITVCQSRRCVNLLGGVGIFALFFSIVSVDDDGFQQELIRPTIPLGRVCAHTRVAPRRSSAKVPISAFGETRNPILISRTVWSIAADQPHEFSTYPYAPTSIHSPPLTSWAAVGCQLLLPARFSSLLG